MYLAQYENKKIFDEAKTTPRSAVQWRIYAAPVAKFKCAPCHRRIQGGYRGWSPPKIFSDTFVDRWFPSQKRPLGWFFWYIL